MIPVFDGHNDTVLLHLADESRDFFSRQEDGHIDRVRAEEGGLFGGFFAIFTPSPEPPGSRGTPVTGTPELRTPMPPAGHGEAALHTNAAIRKLLEWDRDERGGFKLVRTVAEIRAAKEAGVMAGIMAIEGAEAIDPNLAALDVYHAAGLRSLGLVWSRANLYGYGVPFAFPATPDSGPGLTAHGFELVKRCNELGIMVDLSHLNERGFFDVASISSAPLVATHSNAHAVSPSPRNLTDEQLEAVRASGGVVGLNFGTGFLDPEGGWGEGVPIEVMVRHVDHLVDKLGIGGVAIGSDFDGATVPSAIGDASGLQRLLGALGEAGYDRESLEKIASENWLRVLEVTWGA